MPRTGPSFSGPKETVLRHKKTCSLPGRKVGAVAVKADDMGERFRVAEERFAQSGKIPVKISYRYSGESALLEIFYEVNVEFVPLSLIGPFAMIMRFLAKNSTSWSTCPFNTAHVLARR